ncbi:MAG: hypothetical protein PHS96_06710 [Anaerolineales bacterium]|nr:hypothetical protein [Anaerolineales bacterium]
MRRGRMFFYLAFILLLGLVAVAVIWQRYLRQPAPGSQQAASTQVIDIVNIMVVTQSVPRGNVITRDVLKLVPIQRELFIEGMFTNISEVEGRLAKFDLDPGIVLTDSMLVSSAEELSGTGSNAALTIPRGMVAIRVPIEVLSFLSYPVKAGDHVNVIATIKVVDVDTDFQSIQPNQVLNIVSPGVTPQEGVNYLTAQVDGDPNVYNKPTVGKTEIISGLGQSVYAVPSERQRARMVSQTLLQNIMVLNVGNFATFISGDEMGVKDTAQPEATPTPQPEEGEEPAPPPPAPDFISLIVTPLDAQALNYLIASGAQITIVLRPAGDDSRVQTEAATLQFILNQYRLPVPVKLPYALEPRVDPIIVPETTP